MICENCNQEHDGSYGSGRFCSSRCARSFSTKNDIKKTKIIKCAKCQKEIKVDKRSPSNKTLCNDCKKIIIICKNTNNINVPNKIIRIKNPKYYSKYKCKYCGQEECLRSDICNHHQIFPSLIKYFGFNENKIGTIEIYEEFDRIRNLLIEDYVDNELSTVELQIKYKHDNGGNFRKILHSLDINIRNLSNAVINAIKNKKLIYSMTNNYPYKHGYHETWNKKQVFYRSSYELDYYKILDEQKIDYEVEKFRILYWDSQLQKQRVAIPDIYIPETNTIIEIKSDYTYNKQNMDDRVKVYKEHGYNFILILEYEELNDTINERIPINRRLVPRT